MLFILTLQEVKDSLGIGDTQDDYVLQSWIEGLQDRIEQHLSRKLLRAVDDEEIHDGGERFIYVKRWPLESVSNIYVSSDQEWTAANALDADDEEYLVNLPRGKISYGVGQVVWPAGFQNIRTVTTGGFVAAGESVAAGQTAMPEGVRRAAMMQVGYEWRNRDSLGITQVSTTGFVRQQGAGVALALKGMTLLPEVHQTLQPFRRML